MMNIPSPEAQAVLNMLDQAAKANPPSATKLTPADAVAGVRNMTAYIAGLQGTAQPLHSVEDHSFADASSSLRMRLYRPSEGSLPVILFFYGGGFISGTLDAYDVAMRMVAARTGWAIAAAEYRLAPECTFPAAPEDCYAALVALASRAQSFEIDPDRIVIAGESAGGLLAAAVALMTRDRNGPRLAGMLCVSSAFNVHTVDDTQAYPSLLEHDGKIVAMQHLVAAIQLYVPDPTDRTHPYASPGLTSDFTAFPPSLVVTTECDPLRDEGTAFAAQLSSAGVHVETACLEGGVHGVLAMIGLMPETGNLLLSHIARFLLYVSR
jgi:acetyl esterase